MATATSASSSSSPAASSGQGADDNYASSSSADSGADPQGGDNLPGDPPAAAQPLASATPPSDIGTDDSRSADPLKAERRKNNQLEKVIRTLRQQLNRFSEINPSNRGRTPVGLARARKLLHRQELSPQTIDRMVSFFARHEIDKQGSSWETYGKGRQVWDGWGGDPGRCWATGLARRMDAATGHPGPDGSQSTETVPRRRVHSAPGALLPSG